MNTRALATEYRLAQWAQLMQARSASGQSIDEFCQANGISRNKYFYWQRKLREAAAQQLAARQPETALVPSGWAQVTEHAVLKDSKSLLLRIGGAEIELREGFDEALLASVCRVLSSC